MVELDFHRIDSEADSKYQQQNWIVNHNITVLVLREYSHPKPGVVAKTVAGSAEREASCAYLEFWI
jgi:hypothetical protein